MELLAPAGTVGVFEAAVRAGADAVYIGAPFFNAREPARHFSMAEIAAMIDHGRSSGVRVYAAMNSLVKQEELPKAVEILAGLAELGIDALIIQDPGLLYMARKHFPGLRLHASTLMAGHNTPAVRMMAEAGFSRVVLPRELTIEEIAGIAAGTDVELEVFIHGAMCFSYSGLCLFSSFQGGRSSLRGRCVQPCRRRYSWLERGRPKGSGYFFSMNDLQGIGMVRELAGAGVTSLKIEGRMKSANYVDRVVRAYRQVLDSDPGDRDALATAAELLEQAMGRRTTGGYFSGENPNDLVSAGHSGNIGIFLGRIRVDRRLGGSLVLKGDLARGERLRLHREQSGERTGFTLKDIRVGGRRVKTAGKGEKVFIDLPDGAVTGDSLYKVDLADSRSAGTGTGIRPDRFSAIAARLDGGDMVRAVMAGLETVAESPGERRQEGKRKGRGDRPGRGAAPLPLWIRSDDPFILRQRLPFLPERVVINLGGESFNRFYRMKRKGPLFQRLLWALPPVIDEQRLPFFRERISSLKELGFLDWQVGHLGQAGIPELADCRLYGDHTVNILNQPALLTAAEKGLLGCLLSIETDRDNLAAVCGSGTGVRKGMVVYGYPALFTSRHTGPPLKFGRQFTSPRGERFLLRQAWDYTMAVPVMPFSLIPELADLAALSLDYGVIDLSGRPIDRRSLDGVFQAVEGREQEARRHTFNFHHVLR